MKGYKNKSYSPVHWQFVMFKKVASYLQRYADSRKNWPRQESNIGFPPSETGALIVDQMATGSVLLLGHIKCSLQMYLNT